ncbi:hypothetical protein K458DRAFT_443617 [Lentithecium fluviatile CBS 122367]|uniref:DUF6594 domain-containing protein n=1 Tax=Lentithecium fluviatile CBS 122367 TaxID=1168545 RepID=A0A6G1IXC3_9PLEO|nr:hypothetical protein K458DRAFT_443617 [Lentithecium fluviatile CBS 122367]
MRTMPTAAMFRWFSALNARNLLYYQSELVELEGDLQKVEVEDKNNDKGKKKRYAVDFFWLNTSCNMRDGKLVDGDPRQRDLLIKMRALLNEYKFPFKCKYGNHSMLGGDMLAWGCFEDRNSHSDELICLQSRGDTDLFSRWLGNRAMRWLERFGCARFRKTDRRFGTAALKDAAIFKGTFWVTSIIASMLPMLPIFVLVKLQSLTARLNNIAAFNALISVCLTVFTDARRTDVVAVTAAYVSSLYISI